MAFEPLTAVLELGGKVIDKIFPDPEQREKAKLELLRAERDGELEELKIRLSAILSESQSADPWTSRARPSFLYVMYVMILASLPMGGLFAFGPELAQRVAAGMGMWLQAIPEEMWWLFGAGYLGYTYQRTQEKKLGVAK